MASYNWAVALPVFVNPADGNSDASDWIAGLQQLKTITPNDPVVSRLTPTPYGSGAIPPVDSIAVSATGDHVVYVVDHNASGSLVGVMETLCVDAYKPTEHGIPIRYNQYSPSYFDAGYFTIDRPVTNCCTVGGAQVEVVGPNNGLHNPGGLAVDNQQVVWVDVDPSFGAVHMVSKAGGAITTAANSFILPQAVAVDAALIYVLELGSTGQGSGTLWRMSKGAINQQEATPMVTGLTNVGSSLLQDSTGLYFVQTNANDSSSLIERVDKFPANGTTWTLTTLAITSTATLSSLAQDAANLYYYDGVANIMRTTKTASSSGPVVLAATGGGMVSAIAAGGGSVYWVQQSADNSTLAIMRADLSASPAAVTTLFSQSSQGGDLVITNLQVDTSLGLVLWQERGYYNRVRSIPATGGSPSVVGNGGGHGLTTFGGEVYWSEDDFAGTQQINAAAP